VTFVVNSNKKTIVNVIFVMEHHLSLGNKQLWLWIEWPNNL